MMKKQLEVGQVLKTNNANYLLVFVDSEDSTMHLFDLFSKKLVYGNLKTFKSSGELWKGLEVVAIIPKEKVAFIEML